MTAKLTSTDLYFFIQILALLNMIYGNEGFTAVEYGSTEKHHTGCSVCDASQICLLCPTEVTKVGGCALYVTPFKVEQCPPQFQPCCTLQSYAIDEQLNLHF